MTVTGYRSSGEGGPVHVVGASGRSGAALCRALAAAGRDYVPIVRARARWEALGLPGTARIADLEGDAQGGLLAGAATTGPGPAGTPSGALAAALADARLIVSTAHARHAPALLAAAPAEARLVLLGSTRKFTRWPDRHALGVLDGERALLASGRSGVILHPTMIYGAEGENNVRRLAAWLRRLPVLPLPGGGRSLVQPIYQDDVTRAVLASLEVAWDGPHSLVIAGPEAITYREFAAAVARAFGLRPRRVLPVPAGALAAAARLSQALPGPLLPGLPPIGPEEVRRLCEDKAFDIGPMRHLLGISPVPLRQGLAAMRAAARPGGRVVLS